MLELKVKKLTETAKIPTKAYSDDACFDLYADENVSIHPCSVKPIKTGIAFEIPAGYCAIIYGRSGLAVTQCAFPIGGVIDEAYKGEIKVCLYNGSQEYHITGLHPYQKTINVQRGDKIAQFKLEKVEDVTIVLTEELTLTERGENGFGSSDSP